MAATDDEPRNRAGPAFVGRDRELAELLAALKDPITGRGALFLITGDPGIGKTVLASELGRIAAEQGARVAWGRCWEGGGAPPYWPWVQILRDLASGDNGDTLWSNLGRGAPHIVHLLPELGERLPDPVPSVESDAGRFYLFEAVAAFLSSASSGEPLVLIIDDLHAADQSSLLLLRFLARNLRAAQLLVVVAYRDVEATRSPEVMAVLGDLVGEGHVVNLQGLGRAEVGRLIEQHAGAPPSPGKLEAIHEATEGNPLFVREVTRLVAAQDALERPGQLNLPIPESVRAVIGRRLAPLPADAVRVLSAAAVVGRDFELGLLGPACELPVERVLHALSEAVTLGVVMEEPDAVGAYRFTHPLMRDVIYQGLPIPVRTQMHLRVGETLERLHRLDAGSRLAQLAHHFTKAAAAGDPAKAREYARRAGDQAMASCAYEEAALDYGRALEALELSEPDEAGRCELLLRRGDAHARAADYEPAKRSYLRAAEIARTLGDAERLARAALGFGEPQVEGGLVDRELVAMLQDALDALSPEDHTLRARALARLSLEHTFSDDTGLGVSLSQEAVDMARRLGDVGSLGSALRARWLAVWGPEGLSERFGLVEEMLALAADVGDPEMELVGRARKITCCLEAGDIRAVDAEVAAHARAARQVRMPFHEWTAATLRAMRAHLRGALDKAEELADAALSLEPHRPNVRFAQLDLITWIRWEQGRLGELRETWQDVAEQYPAFGYAKGWVCLADAELGREDDTSRGLQSLAVSIHEQPRNGIWLSAVALASVAAARMNDHDVAASLYPLLLPYERLTICISMPHPVVCLGSTSLYLALLATTMSMDEAGKHFESAIEANTRLEAGSLLARTEYEYARLLIQRGDPVDRNRAQRLMDSAAATAGAIGMVPVSSAIEQLRGLEHAGAIVGGSVYLFRREGDYWTIAYEGSLARLQDSKGLRCLAQLLTNPGREFHVLDLEAAGSGQPQSTRSVSDELEVRADLGDAGELLDAQAKAAYRARLEELQEELDEAERFNDPARVSKAREEMDFLTSELARAVGLGGRDRKAASHAERARLNVTRAIRAAMRNLARVNPALGEHLAHAIRTGRYCSYTPDPRAPVTWES